MKAVRIHRFGSPEVMAFEDLSRPIPAANEVLVRVEAAGVGPWDASIRAGRSALPQPLPLTLGSDIAGTIESVGHEVSAFAAGDAVYGVTNERFTGGYAEYAVAKASMIASKPRRLSFIEAASLPVIAVTAWQMLFEQAGVSAGQRVLILGAAGNVGALAVQLAHRRRTHVIAVISSDDGQRLRTLGADEIIDARALGPEWRTLPVDAVIDTAGGDKQRQAITLLKPGGFLVSSVSPPDPSLMRQHDVRGAFFLVNATTAVLNEISVLVDQGALSTNVATVLPLESARAAHEMLAGTRPYPRGKIVLNIQENTP
jgi:NADPH:quinone reductase-like Zn-dependent oxidoreductase